MSPCLSAWLGFRLIHVYGRLPTVFETTGEQPLSGKSTYCEALRTRRLDLEVQRRQALIPATTGIVVSCTSRASAQVCRKHKLDEAGLQPCWSARCVDEALEAGDHV